MGQPSARSERRGAGARQLIFCVAGIYASFLSWAVLQERITTTSYGSPSAPMRFNYPIFLNTIQSSFAAGLAYLYLRSQPIADTRLGNGSIFPSSQILPPLLLVSITSSLASPFGYASLAHVSYLTFILAKSCKLVPVMLLHLAIFRKRYPLYKYAVVTAVTAGVAIFTLHQPQSAKKAKVSQDSSMWGLLLLGINLLFDGLTNSTQDWIFQTFKGYGGPQMMCAQNVLSTVLTTIFLLVEPIASKTAIGQTLGATGGGTGAGEWREAMVFLQLHPQATRDVLIFALCGAIGQLFIFFTLSQFSSILLVTVTVTRKMLTMILSVLLYGHRLNGMQWAGVGLVFGGIGLEAHIQRQEKLRSSKVRGRLMNGKTS